MKKELTKVEFTSQVIENKKLALVKFKTEWSGTCQIVAPMYNELAESYKEVADFFLVDVDKESSLLDEFGIIELPTILFFKKGQLVDHTVGLIPKSTLIDKIENALVTKLIS